MSTAQDSAAMGPVREHWRTRLAGNPPALELPTREARGAEQAWRPARFEGALGEHSWRGLCTIAEEAGVSPAEAGLVAVQSLLLRITGQRDLIIGFVDGVRSQDKINRLARPRRAGKAVDFVLTPYRIRPLRVDLSGTPTFAQIVTRTAAELSVARAAGDAPLEEILDAVGQRPAELFQVLFAAGDGPELACEGMDLAFGLDETSADGALVVTYNAELFDEETVDGILAHLGTLVAGIVAEPERAIAFQPLLAEAEWRKIIVEWNDKTHEFPFDATLHGLFEERVDAAPDAIAAVHRGVRMTYRELDERANQVAHHLRTLGVGPEVLVGISCERSFEMVVGLMGILKAGGAYLPMDPSYPVERLHYMVEDSKVNVILAQQHLADALPASGARVVYLDADRAELDAYPTSRVDSVAHAESLCYVIYTSGSTGKPKGVVFNHRGRVNNFLDFNRRYDVGAGDRVIALASLSFDMCAYDVFGILAAGAAIVLPRPDQMKSPSAWSEIMRRERVTIWHTAPAMLKMLVDHVEETGVDAAPHDLRLVLLGGDWIPVTLPDRLRALIDDVRVISMGGATECSMDSTIFEVLETDPTWKSIPYGEPMTNQLAYVLDEHLQPLPGGVPGELYLGGIGVGRGYFQRPELTAERFLPNPFPSPVAGDRDPRMYRTGDLARWMEDGNLELLGRIDNQVKIRGHRIELGEIEARLRHHPSVREGVVVTKTDPSGEKRLVAYVVEEADAPADAPFGPAVRAFLAAELPDYMVPVLFVSLDAMPLSPNGKVDRKALPEPDASRPELDSAYVAPTTAVEETVAQIWADVLRLDRVGVEDSFLALGGHSLLAVRIQARLAEIFPFEVTPTDLFESSTVSRLAARINELAGTRGTDAEEICALLRSLDELSEEEIAARIEQDAVE